MTERVFVDTNVLVYCHDATEPVKRERALSIATGDYDRVVSTQVLQEYYVTVTRKLATPLSEADAAREVATLATTAVVQIDPPMVLDAIETSQRHRLSLWDALVLHAALAGGCSKLLTEDLQDGFTLGSVRVENPFR